MAHKSLLDREKDLNLALGALAAIGGFEAAKTAFKIAATPLDPLGLPKLPFRVLKLGLSAGVAVAAGAAVAVRRDRRNMLDCVRNAMKPGKE